MSRRAWMASEEGQVGGIEVLGFGLLVFVVGSLLAANAWAVVDAKLAVTAAAREAARTYVESDGSAAALADAEAAGREAIAGHGRDPDRLVLRHDEADFIRCQRIAFRAEYPVPALTLPFVGGFGRPFTVAATHTEIVDPLRRGLGPANVCGS